MGRECLHVNITELYTSIQFNDSTWQQTPAISTFAAVYPGERISRQVYLLMVIQECCTYLEVVEFRAICKLFVTFGRFGSFRDQHVQFLLILQRS